MTDIRRQHSRSRLLALGFSVTLGFTLGACFYGIDAEGLPCDNDDQCGALLFCENDYCGGVFACGDADATIIELTQLCDGTPDCDDGLDEDPDTCGVATPNQCESEPNQALAYSDGPTAAGVEAPIRVVAENFVGGPQDDYLIGGANGMFVKVVSFEGGPGGAAEYYLNGAPPSFGSRAVADFEVADLEGDGDLDIVVATDGDGVGLHVFENKGMGMTAPEPFGPGAALSLDVDIRGLELGKFDGDNWIDAVIVVDVGPLKGQVFTAVGDPTLVPAEDYFAPEFSMVQLDYQAFFDSAAADVDGDGLDDLIVTGDTVGGPTMWVVRRNGVGPAAWEEPAQSSTPGPARDIAVARLEGSNDAGVDIVAIIEGIRLVSLLNNNSGNFVAGAAVEDFGSELDGVTLADVNCDGMIDWLVNVGNPAEVRIWLGDGKGGVDTEVELRIPSVGSPRGGLALTHLDPDNTWDVVQAVQSGGQLGDPQMRVWNSGEAP